MIIWEYIKERLDQDNSEGLESGGQASGIDTQIAYQSGDCIADKNSSKGSESAEEIPGKSIDTPRVNCHIHTPYSFSAFDSIEAIIRQALEEGVTVLGINDFNTLKGYSEWAESCFSASLFPVFNIEMIGLDRDDMLAGRKVNDPNNPGRTYISGKALAYPERMSDVSVDRLTCIRELSNDHVSKMTDRVNDILSDLDYDLRIDFETMKSEISLGMVRERHLAGMIRIMVEENYPSPDARKKVFENLLGIELKDELLSNYASLENTIRSKMLKSGGSAFVEEDQEIFIPVEDIRNLVLDGGGIPTYPFLADFGDANYTDFEADPDEAAEILIEKGFYSIEFIPGRNDFTLLKDYVLNLHKKGFLISFGTEHNAPGQAPLEVSAKAGHPLDKELMSINYEAACVFAAHQYLVWKEGEGWLDMEGRPYFERKEEFRELGDRIIRTIIK